MNSLTVGSVLEYFETFCRVIDIHVCLLLLESSLVEDEPLEREHQDLRSLVDLELLSDLVIATARSHATRVRASGCIFNVINVSLKILAFLYFKLVPG